MRSQPIAPPPRSRAALPAANFADAFSIDVAGPALDAADTARRALAKPPAWIGKLLALRNILVQPFGLRHGPDSGVPEDSRIGMFPIVSSSPDRVVLGFDDRHLDFRIVVDVATIGPAMQRVTATTLVKRHNALGYAYLAAVLPFHKLIVPAILAQITADQSAT